MGRGRYLENQALADAARGMVHGVLVHGELLGLKGGRTIRQQKLLRVERQVPHRWCRHYLHDGNGAGVTEKHLDGRGGHGGEIEGAQLAHQGQVHIQVARLRELASGLRVDADELGALRLSTSIIHALSSKQCRS
eukprot:354438-Prorocentrum_minimum.AAC.3